MLTQFRVLAVKGVLAPDAAYFQQAHRIRYVGRRLERVERLEDAPPDTRTRERDPVEVGDEYHVECWIRTGEPVSVPALGEFGTLYRKMIQKGGLAPADAETAAACGVPFVAPQKTKKAGE